MKTGLLYNKLVLLSCLLPIIGLAELRDPTQPNDFNPALAYGHENARPLKLSMIGFSHQDYWAIIDGQIVKAGQTLAPDIKVMAIESDAVWIRQKGHQRKLTLLESLQQAPPLTP